MTEKPRPGVGVAAVIWEDASRTRLLLGLGHNPTNRETVYAMPGGHWESGETLIDAVRREALEEAGIEIKDVTFFSVYDFYRADKEKSYVSIWFQSVLASGIPTVMEPENKTNWGWYTPQEALQLPLWRLDRVLIERVISGVVYEDASALQVISTQAS